MNVASRIVSRDFKAALAISDLRKAENATARARMLANAELCAALLDLAKRRGQSGIDWAEYFRNAGVGTH